MVLIIGNAPNLKLYSSLRVLDTKSQVIALISLVCIAVGVYSRTQFRLIEANSVGALCVSDKAASTLTYSIWTKRDACWSRNVALFWLVHDIWNTFICIGIWDTALPEAHLPFKSASIFYKDFEHRSPFARDHGRVQRWWFQRPSRFFFLWKTMFSVVPEVEKDDASEMRVGLLRSTTSHRWLARQIWQSLIPQIVKFSSCFP